MLSKIGFALIEALDRYGYAAVFLGVMLENAGVPIPGENMLLTASGFASVGKLSIWLVAISGAVAAIIGDNIGFSISRFGGHALIERYGKYVFIRERQPGLVDSFFNRYGALAIFLARFFAGARVLTALIAGTLNMRWPEFLLFNALGALAWASAVSTLSYYGTSWGKKLLPTLQSLHISIYVLIPIVIALWLVFAATRKQRS